MSRIRSSLAVLSLLLGGCAAFVPRASGAYAWYTADVTIYNYSSCAVHGAQLICGGDALCTGQDVAAGGSWHGSASVNTLLSGTVTESHSYFTDGCTPPVSIVPNVSPSGGGVTFYVVLTYGTATTVTNHGACVTAVNNKNCIGRVVWSAVSGGTFVAGGDGVQNLPPGGSQQICYTNGSPFTLNAVVLCPDGNTSLAQADSVPTTGPSAVTNSTVAWPSGPGLTSTGTDTNNYVNAFSSTNISMAGASTNPTTVAYQVGSATLQGLAGVQGAAYGAGTNVAAHIDALRTNGNQFSTNIDVADSVFKYGQTNSAYTSFGTNTTAGAAAFSSAFGSYTGSMASVSASGGTNVPSGSAPSGSFTILGSAVFFDLSHDYAWLPGLSRSVWGWGCVCGFLMWVGLRLREAVSTMAATQTGGVPDMEVDVLGFGGNLLGTIVAVIVPVVFIGLFVAAIGYVVGAGLSAAGSSYWTAGPFGDGGWSTGPGSAALYFANEYLPLGLMVGLAVARVGLIWGLQPLMLMGIAVARFLFGK